MTEKLSALNQDILTVLLGRELHSSEILIKLNVGRPIPLIAGSLYPALKRLEKKKYVAWQKGFGNNSHNRYYRVTELGTSVLHRVQEYRLALAKRGRS